MRRAAVLAIASLMLGVAAVRATGDLPDGVTESDPETGVKRFKTLNGATMEIKGRSGKMVLGRGDNPNKDKNKVVVLFDAIRELNAAGEVIGATGRRKHSFNSFANQDFTIRRPRRGDLQDIDAIVIGFGGNLASVSPDTLLDINTYIFREAGNITYDGEDTLVERGSVKFTLNVTNWAFCDANAANNQSPGWCRKQGQMEDGEFLEFDLTFQGRKLPARNNTARLPTIRGGQNARALTGRPRGPGGRRKPDRFSMGGGSVIDFSTKIRIDGTWTDMPEGYPVMNIVGNKAVFTFRFPKANHEIFYDPSITTASYEDEDDGDDSAAGSTAASSAVGVLAVIGAFVAAQRA